MVAQDLGIDALGLATMIVFAIVVLALATIGLFAFMGWRGIVGILALVGTAVAFALGSETVSLIVEFGGGKAGNPWMPFHVILAGNCALFVILATLQQWPAKHVVAKVPILVFVFFHWVDVSRLFLQLMLAVPYLLGAGMSMLSAFAG